MGGESAVKYNIVLNDDRPNVVAAERFPQKDGLLLEVPEDFCIRSAGDWRYSDGQWIYDPLPFTEAPAEVPSAEERITELEEALALLLSGVTE